MTKLIVEKIKCRMCPTYFYRKASSKSKEENLVNINITRKTLFLHSNRTTCSRNCSRKFTRLTSKEKDLLFEKSEERKEYNKNYRFKQKGITINCRYCKGKIENPALNRITCGKKECLKKLQKEHNEAYNTDEEFKQRKKELNKKNWLRNKNEK